MSLNGISADEIARARRLHSAFDRMPIAQRLSMLAASIIQSNPNSATAPIAALISLATCMAARLNARQREEVARHMHLEARSLVETGDDVDGLMRLN
jgi:hypothetical protein